MDFRESDNDTIIDSLPITVMLLINTVLNNLKSLQRNPMNTLPDQSYHPRLIILYAFISTASIVNPSEPISRDPPPEKCDR